MTSYDVKFWAIRPGKAKTKRTYEVRWKVGPEPQSRTRSGKAQAENFLSELRQAARKGEPFDTETGLPDSMTTTPNRERTWLAFCLAYIDMKWPSAAPKTRDAITDALATPGGRQSPAGVTRRRMRVSDGRMGARARPLWVIMAVATPARSLPRNHARPVIITD